MKTIVVATAADLDSINTVITLAVMAWPLAERLRRLALPLLRYDLADLACYQMLLVMEAQAVVGVAAWDNRTILASPRGAGALVHGLYVLPAEQGQGVGRLLLADIADRARQLQRAGLLIKAERIAVGYFEHLGLEPLKIEHGSDYPYRFWQPL